MNFTHTHLELKTFSAREFMATALLFFFGQWEWRGSNSLYCLFGSSCTYEVTTERCENPAQWQRAYMEGPRSWELDPPDPGATTVLCRKHTAQKHKQPSADIRPVRSFHEKVTARARKAAKAKQRLLSKLAALQGDQEQSADSSSSSADSSSDSSSQ